MTYHDLFENEKYVPGDKIPNQDFIAWVSQGPISDRVNEHLTQIDTGVILYHKLLIESARKVEEGLDPMGIIRNADENEPWVVIPRENHALSAFRINREAEARSFDPPEGELAAR
jgi:hypothetical protein